MADTDRTPPAPFPSTFGKLFGALVGLAVDTDADTAHAALILPPPSTGQPATTAQPAIADQAKPRPTTPWRPARSTAT